MQTKTTATQSNYFQVYFTDKFRNRDFVVVKANSEAQAIMLLQNKDQFAKNIHAQEITEVAYNKIATNKQNPVCAVSHSYWN